MRKRDTEIKMTAEARVHSAILILYTEYVFSLNFCHQNKNGSMYPTHSFILTLCWAQRPKTSAQGRGQNIPKRPVAIDELRCFHTRKFPYNLTRILWIITVRDFCYFPRTTCIVFVYEVKAREFFKVESMKRVASFWDGSLHDSDNDEWFYGFHAEDIVLREAVADSNFEVNEVSSVHTSDWSFLQQWWLGWRYHDRNRWGRRRWPIDNRFTVRNRHKNQNKHRFGRSRC